MAKTSDKKRFENIFGTVAIVAFCGVTLLLNFLPIVYSDDETRSKWIQSILVHTSGLFAVILLFKALKVRLFGKPCNLLYLLPAICVAVNNFPFLSYFNGNMSFVKTQTVDVLLFATYCLSVGLFEEFVFRGALFALLAEKFVKKKKGLFKTFVFSSLIFGLAHLLNLFGGAGVGVTLLQVGYTTLTGGLFAFVLMKMKNLFCCAFIHALYNFCGLLLDTPQNMGLGSGIVFDTGTVVLTALIAVGVGVFVLYKAWKYDENEEKELYKRLGISESLEK